MVLMIKEVGVGEKRGLAVTGNVGEPSNVDRGDAVACVTTTVPGLVAIARVAVSAGRGVGVLLGGGVFLGMGGLFDKIPAILLATRRPSLGMHRKRECAYECEPCE